MKKEFSGLWRITAILVLLAVPIVLTMAVFLPFVSKEHGDKYREYYRMPENFSRRDWDGFLVRFQADPEFARYGDIGTEADFQQAADEVWALIKERPPASKIRSECERQKTVVEELAAQLLATSFPEDFVHKPEAYPRLAFILRQFFKAEARLTMLALFYKANYDGEYHLTWSAESHKSAQKAWSLVNGMDDSHRRSFGRRTPS